MAPPPVPEVDPKNPTAKWQLPKSHLELFKRTPERPGRAQSVPGSGTNARDMFGPVPQMELPSTEGTEGVISMDRIKSPAPARCAPFSSLSFSLSVS